MAEIMSPLRLTTYRDEKNNTQTFQFVLSEYENEQLSQWESIVSGATAVVQDVSEIETKAIMYFVVTENPTTETPILYISQTPKLYKEENQEGTVVRVEDGACVYGGDLTAYDVTEAIYNLSGLSVLKNGVVLIKSGQNADVAFLETNYIKILSPLQMGDVIMIERTLA